MTFLLLSIACSTIIMLLFKAFDRFGVQLLPAIVVNYWTCVATGLLAGGSLVAAEGMAWQQSWFPLVVVLGSLFIILFFLIGRTAQQLGVTVASVAMKLAFVFPILLSVLVYQESIHYLKGIGIALAFPAVVLSSYVPAPASGQKDSKNWWAWLLPLIVFVGSGVCDSIVQGVEKNYFSQGGFEVFSIWLFMIAAIIGSLYLMVNTLRNGNSISWKSIVGGVWLGIPNYGSIYFLFKTLNAFSGQSAMVFTVNNVGVVLVASMTAIALFKERLNKWNWLGLAFAIAAILAIGMGEL